MSIGRSRNLALRTGADIRKLQNRLLGQHLRYCAKASPFYRTMFARLGLDASRLGLADLPRIPCTEKEDLAAYNAQFLAVPMRRVVDIVQSSGTTGQPTPIMYSHRDLRRLADNEQQSFRGTGVTARDVVLLTCTMDRCFIAGLAYFMGLRKLGAAVVRNGHGTLESHRDILRRMAPTAIVGVPSFLRKLALYLQRQNEDPRALGVRRLICIGEPLRDRELALLPLGRDIEELWGARAYSTYATSEIASTFCECAAGRGGHVLPELAILEILDDQGRATPEGQVGEVVVTPLGVEAMPLLRFRTGDLSFVETAPCACGRVTPRLGPILGRKKQMIKLRGTTLYPQTIASALDDNRDVAEYYIEVQSAHVLSDHVIVHVSPTRAGLTAAHVGDFLSSRLRVRPQVVIEGEQEISQRVFSAKCRKPVRFFDGRKA